MLHFPLEIAEEGGVLVLRLLLGCARVPLFEVTPDMLLLFVAYTLVGAVASALRDLGTSLDSDCPL